MGSAAQAIAEIQRVRRKYQNIRSIRLDPRSFNPSGSAPDDNLIRIRIACTTKDNPIDLGTANVFGLDATEKKTGRSELRYEQNSSGGSTYNETNTLFP